MKNNQNFLLELKKNMYTVQWNSLVENMTIASKFVDNLQYCMYCKCKVDFMFTPMDIFYNFLFAEFANKCINCFVKSYVLSRWKLVSQAQRKNHTGHKAYDTHIRIIWQWHTFRFGSSGYTFQFISWDQLYFIQKFASLCSYLKFRFTVYIWV